MNNYLTYWVTTINMATKIDPKLIEQALGQLGPAPAAGPAAGPDGVPAAAASTTAAPATTFIVQFATPDGAAVDSGLAGVRAAAGVQGVATTSIAIGGTSVMRVTFAGDLEALAAALRAQGWKVTQGANALSIRK